MAISKPTELLAIANNVGFPGSSVDLSWTINYPTPSFSVIAKRSITDFAYIVKGNDVGFQMWMGIPGGTPSDIGPMHMICAADFTSETGTGAWNVGLSLYEATTGLTHGLPWADNEFNGQIFFDASGQEFLIVDTIAPNQLQLSAIIQPLPPVIGTYRIINIGALKLGLNTILRSEYSGHGGILADLSAATPALMTEFSISDLTKIKIESPLGFVLDNGGVPGFGTNNWLNILDPGMVNIKPGTWSNIIYEIYRKTSSAVAYSFIANTTVDADNYTDNSVINHELYSYKIRAYKASTAEHSGYSNEATCTFIECPSVLAGTVISHKQVDLTWINNAPVNIINGYKVYRQEVDSLGVVVVPWAVSKILNKVLPTSCSDTSLKNGIIYQFRVVAYNNYGESNESNIIQKTTYYLPAPTDLKVENAVWPEEGVNISWVYSGPLDYTGIKIERHKVNENYELEVIQRDKTVNGWKDIGVDWNTEYYYRVYTYQDGQPEVESIWSNEVQITTIDNSASPTRTSRWVSDNLSNITGIADVLNVIKGFINDINKAFEILFKAIDTVLGLLKDAKSFLTLTQNFLSTIIAALKSVLLLLKNKIIELLNNYFGMGLYILIQPSAQMLKSALRKVLLTPYVWNGQANIPGVVVSASQDKTDDISRVYDPSSNSTIMVYNPQESKMLNYKKLISDIEKSLKNPNMENRPTFTDDIEVSGIIIALASDNLFMFFRLIIMLMSLLGQKETAMALLNYLVKITDTEYNSAISRGINISPIVMNECLGFINAAMEGLTGIYKTLSSPFAPPGTVTSPTIFDLDTVSINVGQTSDTPFVLASLVPKDLNTNKELEPILYEIGTNSFSSMFATKVITTSLSSSTIGLGNYRKNSITLKFQCKDGTKNYKIYCNKFFGSTSYYTNKSDVSPINFNIEDDFGYLVGSGPEEYSIELGLQADEIQPLTVDILSTLPDSFIGFYSSDPFDKQEGDWWYNTTTRSFRGVYNGLYDHFVTPNIFIITIWDQENAKVIQKLEVMVVRLKLLNVAASVDEAGYNFNDNFRNNLSLDINAPNGIWKDLLGSYPGFNTQEVMGMFPIRISNNSFSDISNITRDNKNFDLTTRWSSTINAVPALTLLYNGSIIDPSTTYASINGGNLSFKNFKLSEGMNVFEILASSKYTAFPIPPVGISSDVFDSITTNIFNNVKSITLQAYKNLNSNTQPPVITSTTPVFATPSFGFKFQLPSTSVTSLGSKSSIWDEIYKEASNMTAQNPPPTAWYSLAGVKRIGQGVVFIHYDIPKQEWKIKIATTPNNSSTWSSWGNYLGIGKHRFWVMGFVKDDEYKLKNATQFFQNEFKPNSKTEKMALEECMVQIKDKLSCGQTGMAALNTGSLTASVLFDVTVYPPRTGKKQVSPPTWVSLSMKQLFNLVDPLDALLTDVIENYIKTPASVFKAVDDMIKFWERKIKNFRKLIQDILDLINLLLSVINIGGTGFWWLGINKAHGTNGFLDRLKKVKAPAELQNAQFVTGTVLMLPGYVDVDGKGTKIDMGGDALMTKTFSKLPSAPPIGDKSVPPVWIPKEAMIQFNSAKSKMDAYSKKVKNTCNGEGEYIMQNMSEIKQSIKDF